MKEVPDEKVNPSYYKDSGDVQCIDAMRFLFGDLLVAGFCICNAFKYMWRYAAKNGDEDIEKAKWYMNEYKLLMKVNAKEILDSIPLHK